MNTKELLEFHKDICDRSRETMRKKNHDYAGPDLERPFANFETAELLGICSTETGFLVRLSDKFTRLVTFVNTGELLVESEGYKDTGSDLVNYMIMLMAYIAHKAAKDKAATADS